MAGISSLKLDGDTARGLKRGDPIAQAEAYRVLAPGVMGMAMRILGDRGLAEEVVQDMFVTVLERAGTLRDAGAVVGWVRQTAVNHCLMRLRSPWFRRRSGNSTIEPADPAQSQARLDEPVPAPVADPRRSLSVPLALAAGLLLTLCASILILGGPQGPAGQDPGAAIARLEADNRALKALLIRSRQLEPLVYGIRPDRADPALLYRIRDLDAELAGYAHGSPREAERLWETRVALLESLAQGRRTRAALQPAVY